MNLVDVLEVAAELVVEQSAGASLPPSGRLQTLTTVRADSLLRAKIRACRKK